MISSKTAHPLSTLGLLACGLLGACILASEGAGSGTATAGGGDDSSTITGNFMSGSGAGGEGGQGGEGGEGGTPPPEEACGDELIQSPEQCDDGGTEAGDGCSATCVVEQGFTCEGEPSECTSECGDGAVAVGVEECDDGNEVLGDGCDNSCDEEPGYTCTSSPSDCSGTCGDGLVALGDEQCDDSGLETGDGCDDDCLVELDRPWECSGEPSVCTIKQPVVLFQNNLNLALADDAYDGSLETMACASLDVPGDDILRVAVVRVAVGLDHTRVGDLVVKVSNPQGDVVTLMSRPGFAEAADDGTGDGGNVANLMNANQLRFFDAATVSAELVGATLATDVLACAAAFCDHKPNPGAGPGASLAVGAALRDKAGIAVRQTPSGFECSICRGTSVRRAAS